MFFFIQADEVEALASIYGDEWCVVDSDHHVYCIQITDGQTKPVWTVCIQVGRRSFAINELCTLISVYFFKNGEIIY